MQKVLGTLIIILFFGQFAFTQINFDFNTTGRRVAFIQSKVSVNPARVTIKFLDNSSNTSELKNVYRRPLFSSSNTWTQIGFNIAANVDSFDDNNVSVGDIWEYQVKRVHSNGTAIGYTCAALRADKTLYKGRVILVIDNSLTLPLQDELYNLKKDLVADGWVIEELSVNRVAGWDGGQNAVAIRQQIKDIYNNAPSNDKPSHLFIFGHVPMPRSGRDATAPDEHDENKGARGADCFYADIDGQFTDNQTYNPGNLITPIAVNLPNDNRFDQDFIPSKLEMAFGRVDFADLGISNPNISEIDLYKRYLKKLHDYKWVKNGFRIPNKCAFNFGYDNSNDGSYRSLIPIVGYDSVLQRTTNIPHPQYVKNNGPFLIYMQNISVPSLNEWNQYGMDAVVFSSDQSYYGFGDVAEGNGYSLIRALLASETKNLVNLWTTTGINIFHQPGVGETFGFSCKQIMDHNLNNKILEKPEQTYDTQAWWNRTHFAYHGDPTLRFFQVAPPRNLQQIFNANPNTLHLRWNKANDDILGYHVYKSATEFGKFDRITTQIITDTNYIATNFTVGEWYMVKAVKEQKTGSGIFLNPSMGASIQASSTTNLNNINLTKEKHIIYPNPTKDNIMIKLNNNETIKTIQLYDVKGNLLFENNRTHQLNLRKYPAGAYFIKYNIKSNWYSAKIYKN